MAAFVVALPPGVSAAAFSDDVLAQLGPRAFGTRQEADGLHVTGDLTEAEAAAVVAGTAARLQAAETARQEAGIERDDALSEITAQYAAAHARMVEIADDPTATDVAGEVRQAVRDVARVSARLLRYLKAQAA